MNAGEQQPKTGGRRRPPRTPKGRQIDPAALDEVRALLTDRPRRRDLLIEHLHLIQDRYGHLSAAHLAALAAEMKMALTEVYEVATFYSHFDVVKDGPAPPAVTVRVCNSLSCAMAGAETLLAKLPGILGKDVRVVRAPCMGACDRAPVAAVGHLQTFNATADKVAAAVKANPHPHAWKPGADFAAYQKAGGYALLKDCLAGKRTRDDLIKLVSDAGLRGLGGAGFPTGRKWQLVRAEPAPRLFAVNADEGEPGTFKDRFYLERDPHRFIEGMLIAAWVVEAPDTYLYIRDEYPELRLMLAEEMAKVEAAGLSPHTKLHLRRGAGAYICGEESAMIESIEGKRGLPRHRPPYVAQVGLFGRPTLEQNVETLYWVRDIVEKGAPWMISQGRRERKGFRSFSVSGRVKKPGVVLAPAGVTARELIEEFCGGMIDGETFKGYLPGGASGGILAGLDGRRAARLRNPGKIRLLRRLARGCHPVGQGRHEGGRAQSDEVLRGRKLRPVHALPGGHRKGGQADGAGPVGRRFADGTLGRHARRVDLRPRPGRAEPAIMCAKIFSGRTEKAAGNLVRESRNP